MRHYVRAVTKTGKAVHSVAEDRPEGTTPFDWTPSSLTVCGISYDHFAKVGAVPDCSRCEDILQD